MTIPLKTESLINLTINILNQYADDQNEKLEKIDEEKESNEWADSHDAIRDAGNILNLIVPSSIRKDQNVNKHLGNDLTGSPKDYDESFQKLIELVIHRPPHVWGLSEAAKFGLQKSSKESEKAELEFLIWLVGDQNSKGERGKLFQL